MAEACNKDKPPAEQQSAERKPADSKVGHTVDNKPGKRNNNKDGSKVGRPSPISADSYNDASHDRDAWPSLAPLP